MIKVTSFDVGQADCILVHMDKELNGKRRYFNLLIDGAYKKNQIGKKLKESLGKECIQGIVVTHVDQDHISGILDIVKGMNEKIRNAFVLFNKYDENMISYNEAKDLSILLKTNFPRNMQICSYSRNYWDSLVSQLNQNPKYLEVELLSIAQRYKCPKIDSNKVYITIVGPSIEEVRRLMRDWKQYNESKKNEEKPGKNARVINEASIVLLIEFDGSAILLSGDGYFDQDKPCTIRKKLEKIKNLDKIDLIKASHHGALENNEGLVDVVKKYHCKKVFFTISQKEFVDKMEEESKHPKKAPVAKHPDPQLLKDLHDIRNQNGDSVELVCSEDINDIRLTNYMKKEIVMTVKDDKDEKYCINCNI